MKKVRSLSVIVTAMLLIIAAAPQQKVVTDSAAGRTRVTAKIFIESDAGMTFFSVGEYYIGAMGSLDPALEKTLFEAADNDKEITVTGYLLNGEKTFNIDRQITAKLADAAGTSETAPKTPLPETPDVKAIKNGFEPGFETTTIGKAFEAVFDNPAWESFETKKGKRVVSFTGEITEALRKSAIEHLYDTASAYSKRRYSQLAFDRVGKKKAEKLVACCPNDERQATVNMWDAAYPEHWEVGAPVTVQWTYNLKQKRFVVSYMNSKGWNEKGSYESILTVIFNY